MHTRFGSDDETEMDVDGPTIPATCSTSARNTSCWRSILVDYNSKNPDYVFKAVLNPVNSMIAASVSNNSIKIYSIDTELTHKCDLLGHEDTITEIGFFISSTPTLVHSCSRDGTLRGWDLRVGSQVEGFKSADSDELLSAAGMDNMVAAGGKGEVVVWDRRTGQRFVALKETHAEDVTQVKFHEATKKVISASEDGLIAVHDISRSLDEDDNFEAALNVGTSVEEIGLYGSRKERAWVRTGTESLHLWNWLDATAGGDEGEGGAFADFEDARSMAAAVMSPETSSAMPQVDYLITCQYDEASSCLLLAAGSSSGEVALWPIAEVAGRDGSCASATFSSPACMFHSGPDGHGHNSIVRSLQCFGSGVEGEPFCITGGEDARICLWSLSSGAQQKSWSPKLAQRKVEHSHLGRRKSPY